MLVQKRKEQLKAYDKQEKQLKEDKASGKSKKQAVCTLIYTNTSLKLSLEQTLRGFTANSRWAKNCKFGKHLIPM